MKVFPLVCVTFVEGIEVCVSGEKFSFLELVWSLYLSIYLSGLQIGMSALWQLQGDHCGMGRMH